MQVRTWVGCSCGMTAQKTILLTAHRNLPEGWAKKMGQPLDDGVSSLVALSGESLLMSGEPLQKFKVAALGGSVAVTPIKVRDEVIGLMIACPQGAEGFWGNGADPA